MFFVIRKRLASIRYVVLAFTANKQLSSDSMVVFASFSARERSVFYFTPFLPDSELVRFAGAV